MLNLVNHRWQKLSGRFLRAQKKLCFFLTKTKDSHNKSILFIFGCQRSGTNLMRQIFEKDFYAKAYGEFSKLSSLDAVHKIRINPLPLVKIEIDKDRVPLVVLKPLVETQNALKLLDYFANSKAVWMYRHYKDVALSNVRHWGIENGKNDLRPIVEDKSQNWRSENVSESTRKIVMKYFSEHMDPYDAAALFWLVRNRLFFELNLHKHPDVTMCKYEDLVTNPAKSMKDIYRFAGCKYPSDMILTDVHSHSKGKGEKIKLSPEIDLLCQDLLGEFDTVYRSKS